MSLSNKQRIFIDEYLKCWNATEAARRAGYAHPNVYGPTLVNLSKIAVIIQERLQASQMSADEVLQRLAAQARGDLGDFMDISSMSYSLDLKGAQEKDLTKLIKKIKQRTIIRQLKEGDEEEEHQTEIELYSAQRALEILAKAHNLFAEKVDLTGDIKIHVIREGSDRTPARAAPEAAGDQE